jgi:hypothetical protein
MGKVLFAVLALLLQGESVAGPSEGVSGKTALDEVAQGLRKYRTEKDPKKRLAWQEKYAATGDPRVALALFDAANNHNGDDLDCEAADLLWWYYASPDAASHRARPNQDVIPAPPVRAFAFGGRRTRRTSAAVPPDSPGSAGVAGWSEEQAYKSWRGGLPMRWGR